MTDTSLVTGGTGFTGSALCRRLRERGEPVRAFVRDLGRAQALQEIGVDCRRVDIGDAGAVAANMDGVRRVYHIAAAYRAEHADHGEFHRVNVEGTRNLLEAARREGVERFVHCSTGGVQGEIEDPPADEDYRYKPGDHYQRSKLDGELLARQYGESGVPVSVVRPIGIYGPGDTRFLKLFRPINRGRFVMIGDGQVLYHLTYIDDLVDGFLLAGERAEAVGQVFTIAGPRYTTIRELVDMIADTLGKPRPRRRIPFLPVYAAAVVCDRVCRAAGLRPPLYPRRVEFFQLDRAFSIDKARRLLGYEPKIDLAEGLSRTARWYREQALI
jgi:nucleoside-diphosphate-sugar epimerase